MIFNKTLFAYLSFFCFLFNFEAQLKIWFWTTNIVLDSLKILIWCVLISMSEIKINLQNVKKSALGKSKEYNFEGI